MPGLLVGCDVGGTFTDAFAVEGDQRWAAKAPTTPEDPSIGAAEAIGRVLARAGRAPSQVDRVVHGTTTATNALLERDLAAVALVTNRGFEDLIEIGRQERPSLYDLGATRPEPLVPRQARLGLSCRLDASGEPVAPVDQDEVADLARQLRDLAPEAVAICLLHAHANGAHEDRVATLLARHLDPVPVVETSHRVTGEHREVERFTTTVLNAGLRPRLQAYLERFTVGLSELGVAAPVTVLDSAGAALSPTEAARLPVRTLLSGPAGGAAAARLLVDEGGGPDLLSVDMGGTSTDVSLVIDGAATEQWETEVAGLRLQVPTADVHTVGAGGGSLAWLDEADGLRVGPRSAGARPGPACYGRGGTEPSVTDACLLLGRIPPQARLGGTVALEVDAARQALAGIAKRTGDGVEAVARAVLEIATAHAVRGIRSLLARHGADPGRLTLVAFGGAGPLFGAEWAHRLGMERVLVPNEAGVTSAQGLLAAPPRTERAQTLLTRLDRLDADRLRKAAGALADEALTALDRDDARIEHRASLRYAGQSHELTVPIEPADPGSIAPAFEQAHQAHHGYRLDDDAIELVALRVRAVADPPLSARSAPEPAEAPLAVPDQTLETTFLDASTHGTPVVAWDALAPGTTLTGPLLVTAERSTTLVPPHWRGRVTPQGHLVLRRGVAP